MSKTPPQKGDVQIVQGSGDNWKTLRYDGAAWTDMPAITIDVESAEQKRLRKLEEGFEAIKDRLAILDDPDPEKLEKHKMLRDAYRKYKMIEKLIGDSDEQ